MTQSNEYTLKAHTVTCATEFTAKRGSELVIVGNVCLGPSKSRTQKPVTTMSNERVVVPRIAKTKPKRRKPDPLPTPRSTRRTTPPTDDDLLMLLDRHGTLTSKRMGDLLNMSRDDRTLRSCITRHIGAMIKAGTVRRTDDPRGNKQLIAYSLTSTEDHSSAAA